MASTRAEDRVVLNGTPSGIPTDVAAI